MQDNRKRPGNGGARPGAGRKHGSGNAATQAKKALAARIAAEGITPLQIMITAMRDLWSDANSDETPNMAKRMAACSIAEKVAPYVHPKLSQVAMNATVRRAPTDFSDDELVALAGVDGGSEGTTGQD